MDESNMITSKEIIEKTGISRATLNNYIKMGILPKPVVRRPGPGLKGIKQIGYFPVWVLNSINIVNDLKQKGKSMDEISRFFQESDREILQDLPHKIKPVVEKRSLYDEAPRSANKFQDVLESIEPVSERRRVPEQPPRSAETVFDRRRPSEQHPKTYRKVSENEFQVTIADISSPAYLINHNFEIEWINSAAEELIFNRNIRRIADVESRNVFRLLLNEHLRKEVKNWKASVQVHLSVLQDKISTYNLNNIYEGISENEMRLLADLYEHKSLSAKDNLYNIPVTLVKADNSRESYWIHTMSFREGTFFVYIPTDSINTALLNMLSQRGKIINELLKNRMPSLVSLCVLVADLQNSVKISAELLPGQYFELINDMWQAVGPIFDKYKGIYGKHAGDGMLYYFIHKPGVNYLMNAINCAIEIREIMKELSSKWRLRTGWNNELFLNTGINEGHEFFGTIQSANNIEFTALGDTINITGRLSDLARNGEIWTTKNLISRLSHEERNMIRFGVHQEKQNERVFIRNTFSRISDLINKENLHYRHLSAIAGLPITEIKEMVQHGSGIQDFSSVNTVG
jgi:class 3 adenylate cyclase/DNA-binding transcriptional MerR regulator